jgi:hypothetical protein
MTAQGAFRNVHMNGQEVFKFAVRAVPTVSASFLVLACTGLRVPTMLGTDPRRCCLLPSGIASLAQGDQGRIPLSVD